MSSINRFSKSVSVVAVALAALLAGCSKAPQEEAAPAPQALTKVRISIDADAMIPRLAEGLGYFKEQGLEIEEVDILKLVPKDYMVQKPLIDGEVHVQYHWFQHAIFGARHNLPIKAVMSITDAPGMEVMVADRVKDKIRSAADFKGRNIAEGAAYATKSTLVNYLAHKEGLPARSYNAVAKETAGRREKILTGIQEGGVDVVAFMEPETSAFRATGKLSTLYDLTTRESTTKVFGATLPSESLLMSPQFIENNRDVAQMIVNAFVKTMRYVNSHSAEEIVAKLPERYLANKDRAAETERIRKTLPSYAQGNYAFSAADVALLVDAITVFPFDDSEPGQWRRTALNTQFGVHDLYTNQLVDEAMRQIPANAE